MAAPSADPRRILAGMRPFSLFRAARPATGLTNASFANMWRAEEPGRRCRLRDERAGPPKRRAGPKSGEEQDMMVQAIGGSKRLALAAAAALMLTACARTPNPDEAGLGAGSGAGGAAPGSQQDLAQTAGDRVFFESDSSELTASSQATLDKQATWLARYPNVAFVVEGHADERGTREYNFALGARRAEAVKNYLSARGVATARFRTTSFGKERPVATCDDISCWSQNRRAVTVVRGAGAS
jgi:peptidoglycan-associated lipoprotein